MSFEINRPHLAESDADVLRFHPGPGASYVPPAVVQEAPQEKLARMERTFLEKAVARALDYPTSAFASDARAIIVQRAAITG